jgi:hypothetical protein
VRALDQTAHANRSEIVKGNAKSNGTIFRLCSVRMPVVSELESRLGLGIPLRQARAYRTLCHGTLRRMASAWCGMSTPRSESLINIAHFRKINGAPRRTTYGRTAYRSGHAFRPVNVSRRQPQLASALWPFSSSAQPALATLLPAISRCQGDQEVRRRAG